MEDDAMKMMGMFAPGVEFMKAISQAASQGVPMQAAQAVGSWAAPSLDPAEVQKKIDDLKAVRFWLSQNAAVLDASIQALEVQRMTLSALKSMDVDFGELGQALKAKPAGSEPSTTMDPVKMWGALGEQFSRKSHMKQGFHLDFGRKTRSGAESLDLMHR